MNIINPAFAADFGLRGHSVQEPEDMTERVPRSGRDLIVRWAKGVNEMSLVL